MMAEQTVYRVYPSIVAPSVLGVAAVYFAITKDLWMLAAIPFIALAWVCSAPNFNLANGLLAVLSALVGLAVAKWVFEPLGVAIFAGSASGWLGGAIEKRIRMRPDNEMNKQPDAQPKVGRVSSEPASGAAPDEPST